MSADSDLLKECKAAGVELFLDNGRLRYRAPSGAYTEEIRQKVAAHKTELIAELKKQEECDKSPPEGNLLPYSKLTPEQRAGIFPTIKAGGPVHVYSETLSESVWWTRDEQTAEALKQDSRYLDEAIYTLAELRELAGQGQEFLKDIHRFKREFGARLERAEPKPMLRAGVAFITAEGRR